MWARGELTTDEQQAADDAQLDTDLAAFGLRLERPSAAPAVPEFYLYPENVTPWHLWLVCQPDMRRGMYGPEGLDKTAVDIELRRGRGWPRSPRRQADLWEDLRAIERTALAVWAERRASEAKASPQPAPAVVAPRRR